ncbi:MAG: hypothetical protein WBO44_09770 [Saprospiraceae bacterium]
MFHIKKVFFIFFIFSACTDNEPNDNTLKLSNLIGSWKLSQRFSDYENGLVIRIRETNDQLMILNQDQSGEQIIPSFVNTAFRWYYQSDPDKFIKISTQGDSIFTFASVIVYDVIENSKQKHVWTYWQKNNGGPLLYDSSFVHIELIRF